MLKQMMLGCVVVAVLAAACSFTPPAEPSQSYQQRERLLTTAFDDAAGWRTYEGPGVHVRAEDGVFRFEVAVENYVWSQHDSAYENTVIEVKTFQQSTYRRNGYGIMCRASVQNNGKGYYFLISADGYYSIRRGDVRAVTPLVRWEYSDAINQDQGGNTLRAVCVDDYLAFYVNEQFLAEARDDRYNSGHTGLAVVLTGDGEIDILFDDLKIWRASQ